MTNTHKFMIERRSAKRYQENFKIEKSQIKELLEIIRYSPTSYGMEAYKVYCILNQEIKEEMFSAFKNQPAVKECSALIIWTVFKEEYMKNFHIEKQARTITNPENDKGYNYIQEGIKGFLVYQNVSMENWLARQVYISLGALTIAIKEMNLDCCPVEGFVREELDNILSKHNIIDNKIETSTVCLFLGKIDDTKKNHYSYKRHKKTPEETYKIIE
ncbi:nitroreductase [Spiroplasma gladiatoris]|uniref:Nitroreductase n=1 Tax=Spiroplasma gladiatoris TaxID=2143 RepID=A0A4V1AQ61_9MOLU|nr:nitroreductase family protein [Spiroplasma gladiatoris]QBQ07379.1 nitroreductase [Spiroplasma gladiatoris]